MKSQVIFCLSLLLITAFAHVASDSVVVTDESSSTEDSNDLDILSNDCKNGEDEDEDKEVRHCGPELFRWVLNLCLCENPAPIAPLKNEHGETVDLNVLCCDNACTKRRVRAHCCGSATN